MQLTATYLPKKLYLFYLLFLFPSLVTANVSIFNNQVGNSQLEQVGINVITQNNLSYMWAGTTSGIYKYNGTQFLKQFSESKLKFANITDILVARDQSIWIGTRKNGLFHYRVDNGLNKVTTNDSEISYVKNIAQDLNGLIWVSTNSGVFNVDTSFNTYKQPDIPSLNSFNKNAIGSLEIINENQLLVATIGGFFIINIQTKKHKYIALKNKNDHIHDFLLDSNNTLWIATSSQLYKYDIKTNQFMASPSLNLATRILSIVQQGNTIWVATIDGGIFHINTTTNRVTQYLHDINFKFSLPENNIMTLFISKQEVLWIGSFSKGLSSLNLKVPVFDFETRTTNSLNCLQSTNISSINNNSKGDIFVGNEYGLTTFNKKNKICENIHFIDKSIQTNYTVYSTRIENEHIWIASSKGLLKYNQITKKIELVARDENFSALFFSTPLNNDILLIGTDRGLFKYSILHNTFLKIKAPYKLYENKSFLKYAVNSKKEIILPTSSGVLYLNEKEELKILEFEHGLLLKNEIIAVQINKNDEILVSIVNKGLFHFDSEYKLIKHYLNNGIFSKHNPIYQIQFEESNNSVWLGSEKGLINLNLKTEKTYIYSGLREFNHLSVLLSSNKSNNTLYFSGKNGYISFNPKDIENQYQKPKIFISDLFIMNKPIKLNEITQSLDVKDSIEQIQHFNFDYKDKIIEFRFVDLLYQNTAQTNYFYKLEPLYTNWIQIPNTKRDLIFTNLTAGKYELLIKATINNDKHSSTTKKYSLLILPAPWLTWWAYLSYLLLTIITIKLYIRYKIKSEERLNFFLNSEVKKKTQFIQEQKEKLEALMDRKNEIFANVTHEFRTPITLIKGPISELQKQEKNMTNLTMLNLIERNSNRLLRLVNQMLELSQVTKTSSEKKQKINIANALKLIADSYTYLAKDKNITFEIKEIKDIELLLTEDALELMIGNLLSNAFKYTQNYGEIILGSTSTSSRVDIYVQDNGSGFCMNQKETIFKRFGRLTQHQNLDGAGIGLSIVKETALLNNAEVYATSTIGQGSRFSISFPIHKIPIEKEDYSLISNQVHTNNKATVLIIEDNDDMRFYIQKILSKNFNCLMASNGKEGVALAIKSIPDIIISDIMMPGIDGYHVCRLLREETITSHIPLVLLTALIEKANRIKGWRENIDMYLCKPFDADELNLQLMNILNIRNILKQNNREKISTDNYSELPEKDRSFLEKLNSHIEELYFEPSFNLTKMSELMFITERQLQRKIKAIVNLTPIELLREYRLKKASESLKNGYQISITSDTCGFGSVSYFSQVFKKHFGLTPKQYQNRFTKNK